MSGFGGGESFSLDASLIRADVNQVKRVPGDRAIALPDRSQASRAVREYFDGLDRDGAKDQPAAGSRAKKPPGSERNLSKYKVYLPH